MSKLFETTDIKTLEKLYVHPGLLINDPSLVVKKEGSDIYSFPLFTELFCERVIQHAEKENVWTKDRHNFYPTTDCLLASISVEAFYRYVLITYIVPVIKYIWRYTWLPDELVAENFIVKYAPEHQSALATHNDEAWFSIVATLNSNFKGGGTSFPRQNLQVTAPMGYATVHPGRLTHPHGGLPVTEGTRYIIVSFCKATKGTNP